MKIVFYTNCQYAGIQYFLELFYAKERSQDVSFAHIENYTLIRDQGELDQELLGEADIFIYQPIARHHGIYSTSAEVESGVMSYLKPSC